mmetsp:Transcript_6876/g.10793  ORF Transcript_6876/g.10793 Transcript_6876/m.10793 type:complete len:221 (+) Transcript_6876:1964-2626(+)
MFTYLSFTSICTSTITLSSLVSCCARSTFFSTFHCCSFSSSSGVPEAALSSSSLFTTASFACRAKTSARCFLCSLSISRLRNSSLPCRSTMTFLFSSRTTTLTETWLSSEATSSSRVLIHSSFAVSCLENSVRLPSCSVFSETMSFSLRSSACKLSSICFRRLSTMLVLSSSFSVLRSSINSSVSIRSCFVMLSSSIRLRVLIRVWRVVSFSCICCVVSS